MLSPTARLELATERLKQKARQNKNKWPAEFVSKASGRIYKPHNDSEWRFVYEDVPRYSVLLGGEGSGKSTAGIIKVLNRLRRGMSGIMVGPDLPHFKRTVWPEFYNWCPVEMVIERHQHRFEPGWEGKQAFTLVFRAENGKLANLICGGADEINISAWEGPNVSFVHFDEARRHKTGQAIKVFDGRIRIAGPNGEPPQLFLTTTPKKHWLFEYFAGAPGDTWLKDRSEEIYADFRENAYVARVSTEENAANLSAGYVADRRTSLTEAEARVLVDAQWEDDEDTDKFIQILWWDACQEDLPALTTREPMVIALDAATGGATLTPDTFAMIGVTRHPTKPGAVAVRYVNAWSPPKGGKLDYEPIKQELIRLCETFSIIEVTYDPKELHYFSQVLMKNEAVALFREFSQVSERLRADKQLKDMIQSRQVAHNGDRRLREHIDNADGKKHSSGLRLVKRTQTMKIDLAVALSMAASRCLYYNQVY